MWTAAPLVTRWPAAGVWAMMVAPAVTSALVTIPDVGMVNALTSSTMRMPMGATRAEAEASVRPVREGMTKPGGGASTSSGSLTRRLTRGLWALVLGLGVW